MKSCLSSDVTSKEATLQVVYDVLKLTPFYKAFQVTADAPEIYMQEFWASAYVHNRSVRFKMITRTHYQHPSDTYVLTMKMEILLEPASNKLLVGDSLNLPDHRIHKDGDGDASFQLESNSLPHAHAQTTKTYYKHQDSRIMKAQELKTKTSAQTLIYKIFPQRYQVYQGRLLASFQDDAKYEHTKSKDNDKGSRSKITKHEGTSLQRRQRQRSQELNDKSNLIDLMKECHNELTSGEIVQATQEIEDTHVTLTPVNPDGQQQSSSVSSGFVSNMLNPNQDTGVDDIFGQHTEATSLIDTPVTAIMEPSFTAQINRPPTPYPLVIQTQQPPILTPATTTSSSLQNLPNFASLFGFDYRLKALEDNFSELRQTNQYAEALSSIPGTVDQYLANKMQEAVDVAVQLKYDRIREESTTANQQFLDSIDEGMKKIIKEQVKKEVSKITPKIEKLVTDQLESEVLVRSSKEANTSHAVAANLSELELKKILIDKMEANNSINRSDIQRQLYKALVDAYEADKILLDTYGDTVTIKRPRDGADDDQEPSAGTDRGSKRRRSGKEPDSTSAPSETTTKTAGKTTSTGSKTHKKSASQSAPVEETMQTTDGKKRRQFYAFATSRESISRRLFKKTDILLSLEGVWKIFQLGVESYQRETQPQQSLSTEHIQSEKTRRLIPYSDPRGFIYENKDKKNRLMRIDELHKFSDGTLDDVRTALNDRKIYPRAIDKRLKTRDDNEEYWRDLSVEDHTGVTYGYYKGPYDLSYVVLILKSHGPSDAKQQTLPATKSKDFVSKPPGDNSFSIDFLTPKHAEYDESNTYVLERFNTTAGNPVKKILLKLNLSDHRLFKMVVECQSVKVKEFQERCNIKAFQEWYEHVGPEVASPQDGKVSRWQRDCAWLMISRCSRSQCQIQVQGTSSIQEVNDHYNIFTRESQEYELKTKDKA
ncbi:hypothetical protein Tco_1458885 [Tanacetum coccineum]